MAEPTPADVVDRMREIFERPEFRRSKSLLERIMDWLAEHLGGNTSGPSGGGWGGSIGPVVSWVAIVLLLLGLAVIVFHVLRNRSPRVRRRRRSAEVDLTVEEHLTATEWASEADRLESAGRWKDAIRARYRELVERLVERGVAAPQPGRTTGELRADVDERAPEISGAFADATVLFELPWYADVPTGPEENAEFKRLATAVLERAT